MYRTTAALLALLLVGLGACTTSTTTVGDTEHANLVAVGKADVWWTPCELEQVLQWVSDPLVDTDTMAAAGVNRRAANHIATYRDGEDGLSGTADDHSISSLQELDDISWVGPVTFEQLVLAVRDRCDPDSETAPTMSLEVVFSPQEDYWDSLLGKAIELMNVAEHSIDLAMYSFRDKSLIDELEAAVERGVRIRAILDSARGDRSDPDGTISARLEEIGIDVRYVNKIMHHKFMLVDGRRAGTLTPERAILLTGSGNFSYSAGMRFDENTMLVEGNADIAGHFQREFTLMWNNSRDFEFGDVPSYEPLAALEPDDIPDDRRFEMLFTSDNFDLKTTSYGPTFSVVPGRNTVSDRLVELIEGAESSILVASGHLRSRPVAEALLARHAEDPSMDIRVYLDGQEYISSWYYEHLVRQRELCLEQAEDSESKKQACLDKGFYYSYALHEAGIPVRFKHYAYRWHYSYAPQMHHKYLVIDGATVATGSYNLSDNAEHNTLENLVVYEVGSLAESFTGNFEAMWTTGQEDDLYEQLLEEITEGTDDIPLVYDSMALTWDEVKVLKDSLEAACTTINNWDYKKYPQSHKTCPRAVPE